MRYRSPVLFSIFALVALLLAFVPLPQTRQTSAKQTFQVKASSFEFSPAEITVNKGDQVTIELTSLDVVHGLYLDGYGLQVEVDPGQTETLTFTADRSGTFRFRCSVTCGDLHPFMIGKLHVGAKLLFWRSVGLVVLVIIALWVLFVNKFQQGGTSMKVK